MVMKLMSVYNDGGIFYMNLISLTAVVALVVAGIKIYSIVKNRKFNLRLLDLILMAGSLGLAIGLLSQIIGIVDALTAIKEAADVSPQLLMEGAKVSFYAPIWGFMVFIFSLLFYFILKEIIKAHKN